MKIELSVNVHLTASQELLQALSGFVSKALKEPVECSRFLMSEEDREEALKEVAVLKGKGVEEALKEQELVSELNDEWVDVLDTIAEEEEKKEVRRYKSLGRIEENGLADKARQLIQAGKPFTVRDIIGDKEDSHSYNSILLRTFLKEHPQTTIIDAEDIPQGQQVGPRQAWYQHKAFYERDKELKQRQSKVTPMQLIQSEAALQQTEEIKQRALYMIEQCKGFTLKDIMGDKIAPTSRIAMDVKEFLKTVDVKIERKQGSPDVYLPFWDTEDGRQYAVNPLGKSVSYTKAARGYTRYYQQPLSSLELAEVFQDNRELMEV